MDKDEKILKKMAVNSAALMVSVVLASSLCTHYDSVITYANDRTKDAKENSADIDVLLNNNYGMAYMNDAITKISDELEKGKEFSKTLGEKYIRIPKNKDDNLKISVQDIYTKHSIKISISGLTDKYIDMNQIERINFEQSYRGEPCESKETNDVAKNVKIVYYEDYKTGLYTAEILMELNNIYAPAIYDDNDNFYVSLKRPKEVYEKIVVVDAGHGGNDIGTFTPNVKYYEKDFNLDIVLKLRELLEKENIKVYYTRLSDEKVYLKPRVSLANDVDADLFVSVHCNASKEYPEASGIEVLYGGTNAKVREESQKIASGCLKEVNSRIKNRKRGLVQRDDVYIIGHSKVPVALIECGYLTNSKDLSIILKSENRNKIAEGIYEVILKSYEEK